MADEQATGTGQLPKTNLTQTGQLRLMIRDEIAAAWANAYKISVAGNERMVELLESVYEELQSLNSHLVENGNADNNFKDALGSAVLKLVDIQLADMKATTAADNQWMATRRKLLEQAGVLPQKQAIATEK